MKSLLIGCLLVAASGSVGFLLARMLPAETPKATVNLAGEHSATITVLRPDGSKAAGEPWTLRFRSDGNASGMGVTYGNPPKTRQIQPTRVTLDLTLAAGTVPASGVVELKNLPGGEWTQPLNLSAGAAGHLSFSLPDETKLHESFTLQLPADLDAGNQAPQMEVVRVSDGTATTLPVPGKVSYLEFWGVHCGPCQKPLKELDAVAQRRGAEWESVHLASICLDHIEDVKRHVAARSLSHVEHFVPTGGHPTAGTPNPFGVMGVPRAFLIDANGRIVWVGHPNGFDVEREIEALLAK